MQYDVCVYVFICVCVSVASDARLSYIISSFARVVSGGLILLIDGIGTGKMLLPASLW